MIALDHTQHWSAERRGRGVPIAANNAPHTDIAYDQFQFRGNSAPVGQPRHISRRSLPRTWPGDLARRPGLFLIRTAGGLCMGITRRADALAPSRLRRPAPIAVHNGQHRQAIARTRWPAVQILRSPCGCALSFQQHASCQGVNAFEGHQRLSSSVGFNANRHSERRFADEKIQLPREQNE